MRLRTDARRKAIVEAAWAVFRENGFNRTTMSEISERVGGSKATLYGYFESKELLFAAALEQVIGNQAEAVFARLSGDGTLKSRLLSFARDYLLARISPNMLAVERALIAEGERSDLGERQRMHFVRPHWERFAVFMRHEMNEGKLRFADPFVTTWHFRGLVEADILERCLHGDTAVSVAEIDMAVEAGVEIFLRAYATGAA